MRECERFQEAGNAADRVIETLAAVLDVDVAKADWTQTRTQMSALLSTLLPVETQALSEAIRKGKIDGSTDTGGLFATLAGIRKFDLTINLASIKVVERMCMGIRKGDTPANNPLSKLLVGWIAE
jgi:hypothetical protein